MGPKFAKLIKLSTSDGLMEMHDHIKIGKIYTVFPEPIKIVRFYNFIKKVEHKKRCIYVICPKDGLVLMPIELFEILGDKGDGDSEWTLKRLS